MPDPCTVLIGAADLLPALKARTIAKGEVLTFTDVEALHALEVIAQRRPQLVVLERLFAATSRGAALINRVKADPTLADAEIRIVSHDSDYSRVSPRRPVLGVEPVGVSNVPPLDYRGTRRAPRFRMADQVEVLVDGNPATLIDLSTFGAQVFSSTILRPNQRVRMALNDDTGNVKFNAAIAWASFEMGKAAGPRYRAGIEFNDADPGAVELFCARHRNK